ncbi:flavin reductase [Acinetobacter sp.]|jgi:flavin reductase (DIM6/NTAB) family NADH-FMN oxidoreductase RutF/predicted ester cyclase|uniref:flavin reductase n=1 Tax=Acinetobacter sp. TaxID=472 RepID=UPI00281D55F4|nr:flavin reductase [Acinetobacter sp.]MDR0236197.1 flavin reductase [Acinetobacter sp.]
MTTHSQVIEPADQRKLFSLLPTGVVAITGTTEQDQPTGLVVGTFQSLSLEPALVTFCVDKSSSTWPVLRNKGKFTANILSTSQVDVCKALGRKGDEKFKGLSYENGPIGTPRLAHSVAWIDCTVLSEVIAGDHFMIVGAIKAFEFGNNAPLVFSGGKLSECLPLPVPTTTPSVETTPADLTTWISNAWSKAWGEGDINAFASIVSPDYVRYAKDSEQFSLADIQQQIQDSHAAFTNFKVEILHTVEQQGMIALHWRTVAKHTGAFMGVPATQRNVTVFGSSFMKHKNGLITQEWVVWDPRELLASIDIWHLGSKAG